MSNSVSDLPPEALFNRYFIDHEDACVRNGYLGLEMLSDVVEKYLVTTDLRDRLSEDELKEFIAQQQEFKHLLEEVRDHLNTVYEEECKRALVSGQNPKLHFNYISVNPDIPIPQGCEHVNKSGAIAFVDNGWHFIGVTIPLAVQIFDTAVRLSRSDRIAHAFCGENLHEEKRRQLATVLFSTQLQFIACHELGHHVHGHQGKSAAEAGKASLFIGEADSDTQTSGDMLDSQVSEIQADGYAVKMMMNNLLLGSLRDVVLQRIGRGVKSLHGERYILKLLAVSVGSFFFARPQTSFDAAAVMRRRHPPQMVRMHFVMTALRQWSTDNGFPGLVAYADLKRYRTLMASIEEAMSSTHGRSDFQHQSQFLEAAGRPYLDKFTKRDCTLRKELQPWRWVFVGESSEEPDCDD